MTCPAHLIRARYADGALAADAAEALNRHLEGCPSCREAVARLRAENEAIGRALKTAEVDGVIPAFVPRPTIGPLLGWIGWFAVAAWAVNLAWTTVAGTLTLPGWLDWLVPDMGRLGIETLLGLTVRLVGDGGDAIDLIVAGARNLAVLVACAGATWYLFRRAALQRHPLCLGAVLALTALIATPQSHAFELRHDDDRITVAATETIDDTLIVSADRILIEGAVTGDLIAVGEEITIRGAVGGTLLAFGESVVVEGIEVRGNVVSAGEKVDFSGTSIGGNFYGAGASVTVRDDSRVGGNVAFGAETVTLEGQVARDAWLGAKSASISGSVLGDVRAYAETIELLDGARVAGDLRVKVRSEDSLKVAAGAEVGGETSVDILPEPENPYLTVEYYLGIALRIAAALLAGVTLFHLFPTLAGMRIDDAMQALTTAGIGAVALVATPVLALLVTATLVGAPLGITVLLLFVVSLYVAGILTANLIGGLLPARPGGGRILPLLAGLVVVFVLISLPLVGGVFRFIAVIVGLGLLLLWLRGCWLARSD